MKYGNFNHQFVPVKLADAQAFIEKHHRHTPPLKRHKFSIGVRKGETDFRGVATVDRCSGSWSSLDDHLEIRRLCTDGTPNLPSFLLGKASAACFNLGATVCVTYTRFEESCSSLLADNWTVGGISRRKGHPPKVRWHKYPDWFREGESVCFVTHKRRSIRELQNEKTAYVVGKLREYQKTLKVA